ncbi:hypothetical protein BDZ89DRAFT_1148149 [Hymenopellis radicata]|nr:hypothetical protein BDZ89DRAFT_1148149 [Hymenopellis radicata]
MSQEPEIFIHFLLIGHSDFEGVNINVFSCLLEDDCAMDEPFLLNWIQNVQSAYCPATCFWEAAEVYQVDIPWTPTFVPKTQIRESPELFGRRVTTPISKHVYRNFDPQKLHFAVYPKHLTKKRARVSSEPSPYPQTVSAPLLPHVGTVRPSKKSRKVILTRIDAERFLDNEREIYKRFPVFRCGNPAVPISTREPSSDFFTHLQTDGVLLADFSRAIADLDGDVNGFFTSPLSRSSAKSYSSMLKYYRDRHYANDFVDFFGPLTIGPWAAENPLAHSHDYILSFIFPIPRGFQTLESILQHLTRIIDQGLQRAIEKYGDSLSIASTDALFGKKNGCAALEMFLNHFHSETVEDSASMSIFIEDYDSITRYAEFISLTSPPSTPSYPSVNEIIDLLDTHFYDTIYAFKESFGARVYFFGVSPALCTRLSRFSPTDATKLLAGFGAAGYGRAQFQACVAALRGDLDARGQLSLKTALEYLPKYHCGPYLGCQIPQMAIYARRGKQWEPSLTELTIQGLQIGVPVSDPYAFYHAYGDFPPDEAIEKGYKLVQCPETPQAFYALCYDEGILTGNRKAYSKEVDVSERYVFPCEAMKKAFLQKVVKTVKMTGMSILEPFNGTAAWWYNALAWYLKATRTAVSNYYFNEGQLQCLSLNLCQTSLAIGAGSTTRVTLETETNFRRRIDLLFIDKNLMVVTEDKNISVCNIIEGTLGFGFPRTNHKVDFDELEPKHTRMITAFSEYCRNKLPETVFKDTPFMKDYPRRPRNEPWRGTPRRN